MQYLLILLLTTIGLSREQPLLRLTSVVPYMSSLCFQVNQPRRLALVIGNSDYKEAPLKNPVNDAKLISAELGQVGFKTPNRQGVTPVLNCNKDEMNRAISQFAQTLRKGDACLFFFAGHGIEIGNRNYLIPIGTKDINSEADAKKQCIRLESILDTLGERQPNLQFILLDCCRDNPVRSRSFGSKQVSPKRLIQEQIPEATVVWYATEPKETASDGIGGNSPFTRALVSTLKQYRGSQTGLELGSLTREVSQKVKKETGQRPDLKMPISMDDFFIVRGATKNRPISTSTGQSRTNVAMPSTDYKSVRDSFCRKNPGYPPYKTVGSGIKLLLIPPGLTVDGEVNKSAFYFSSTEVSQKQWTSAGMTNKSDTRTREGRPEGVSSSDLPMLPIESCSHAEAASFAKRIRCQLPTRKQWLLVQKLASKPANGRKIKHSVPVTEHKDELGFYGLSGNVSEFLRDGSAIGENNWGKVTRSSTGVRIVQQ